MSRQFWLQVAMIASVLAMAGVAGSPCAAAPEHLENFDGDQTICTVDETGGASVRSHRLDRQIRVGEGRSSEAIEFFSPRAGGTLSFYVPLKPSRVYPELTAAVQIRSNRPGATVWLRVVFPNQKDPEKDMALTALIRGETYSTPGKWQQLRCMTTDKRIQEMLVNERARLRNPNLNHQDLYVDRIYVAVPVSAGPGEIFIDDLRFGPIVDPRPDKQVEQVVADEGAVRSVELRLGRLEVEGRPYFARITPYHGESIESLKNAGFNVVLIPDLNDRKLLAELKQHNMWAMAEPPCAVSESGEILDARTAGIVPFGDETARILIWYVGTLVPEEKRANLIAWNEQIRHADRKFRRPIAADVMELERVFSRHLDLLSTSRHSIGTTMSPKDYRDWLIQKRKLANPGTFPMTWTQTEPVAANSRWRESLGRAPIVIEPEQIRMQVYAALSAGCRAIGYWKRTSLDDKSPGAEERRLVMTMINLELELLEPWLAAGSVSEIVPFTVGDSAARQIGRREIDSVSLKTATGKKEVERLATERMAQDRLANETAGELEAAIIESHLGTLVLAEWYDRNGQFVPKQNAANDASLVIPGVHDSAQAWEITPTSARTLSPGDSPGSPSVRKRVPGGLQVRLKKFDQDARIVLSDLNMKEKLDAKIEQIAPAYSRAAIDLAKAKLARVRVVDEELRSLDVLQTDAPQILSSAQQHIDVAEAAWDHKDYDTARIEAADAMQAMRILQRAHWNQALRMSSPISSPYTICFQTLPDHWRMINRIGRAKSNPPRNLLESGNFENQESIIENWFHSQNEVEGVRAAAELYPVNRKGAKGNYALRMIAVPAIGVDTPHVISQSPVTVCTPPVPVTAGQLVHIAGWVRVSTPVTGSLDGIMLYDNLTGSVGALRFRDKCNWQRFELVREVRDSGDFSLTMSLNGLGEVQFDDLKIVPLEPQTGSGDDDHKKPGTGSRGDLMRFLNPWQNRKTRTDEKRANND
ncbi:MAG: hypothetical protein AB7O26_12195 [Planctomycetaceae bacterium]